MPSSNFLNVQFWSSDGKDPQVNMLEQMSNDCHQV